jgi:hypothetical protein
MVCWGVTDTSAFILSPLTVYPGDTVYGTVFATNDGSGNFTYSCYVSASNYATGGGGEVFSGEIPELTNAVATVEAYTRAGGVDTACTDFPYYPEGEGEYTTQGVDIDSGGPTVNWISEYNTPQSCEIHTVTSDGNPTVLEQWWGEHVGCRGCIKTGVLPANANRSKLE